LGTTNYPQLQDLFVKYNGKLAVLAFPSNQFNQEPSSNSEIKEKLAKKEKPYTYGLTYDFFGKIDVNGDSAHPLYKFLKSQLGGWFGSSIKWNFTKFLVDANGKPVKRFAPTDAPVDLQGDIDKLIV